MQSRQNAAALGNGLIQSIREKEDERLQIERTVHQLRLRIREETKDVGAARAAEEAKVQEVLTLEKKVGALTQRYQRAVKENGRLTSESSGFQRSLKELEEQQRDIDQQVAAQRLDYVHRLEAVNDSYLGDRALMKVRLGHEGPGCATLPTDAELAKMQAALTGQAEAEARAERAQAELAAARKEHHDGMAAAAAQVAAAEKAAADATLQAHGDAGDAHTKDGAPAEVKKQLAEVQSQLAEQRAEKGRLTDHVAQLEAYLDGLEARVKGVAQDGGDGASAGGGGDNGTADTEPMSAE